uniref:Cytochrome b5 n=1 Tax=Arion vulgaris TaxID=1028688 RepID=A0A0B6Y3E5_9EUPU
MSATIQRGLCWALTALHVTPENSKTETTRDDSALHKSYTNGPTELSSDFENSENIQPTFSRKIIADHCSSESCWMVINNKVYDVTRFLRVHPGGDDIMLEYGGHDATSAFIDKGHSLDACDMLSEYLIGNVTKADWYPEINFT